MSRPQLQHLHFVVLFATVIALVFCVACRSPELKQSSNPNSADDCLCGQTNWTKYISSDGGYSVLMPSAPTLKTINNLQPGNLSYSSSMSCPTRLLAFTVLAYDYPHDFLATYNERILDILLKESSELPGKKLISKQRVQHHQYPGLEWIISAEEGKAVVAQRAYLVGERVYVMLCVMPNRGFCSRHAAAFFNSFKVENPQPRRQ